jgi:hypothetical protein
LETEDYLNTSYPDGDREFLDGEVVERSRVSSQSLPEPPLVLVMTRRDFPRFEVPDRGPVPFDTIELLRRLDAE